VDSFSTFERRYLLPGRRLMTAALMPLVRVLARRGVSPNAVSALQVPVGVLAALVMRRRPRTALALVAVAVLLDALDGTLARATGQATPRGALVDQLCDHARELLVAAAITRAAGVTWRWAALYALLYPASNVALAAANRAGRPVPLAVKPIFTLYPAAVWFLWCGDPRGMVRGHVLTAVCLLATIAQAAAR
jgi:phosphatidylglycerophosphate synthase